MDTGEAGVGRDRAALLPRYAALHADVERYRALFAAAPSALLVTT